VREDTHESVEVVLHIENHLCTLRRSLSLSGRTERRGRPPQRKPSLYLEKELVPIREDTHESVEVVLHEEICLLNESEQHLLQVAPLLSALRPFLNTTRPIQYITE
jgi:hypothetical protein